jgi:molybdopterin-guanine dinucleotide biosynthesis protein MobB
MKPVIIAVVGGKKSGKTTTIEILIKKLTERGHRTAAIKHIPEPDFTFDQKGKDTWKYAQAGATEIIGVSAHEIVTIEKTEFKKELLIRILHRRRSTEIIFLEGFKDLIAKNKSIFKIVVLNSENQAEEDSRVFAPILALTGPYHPKILRRSPPYVDVLTNPDVLVDLVEKLILKRRAT